MVDMENSICVERSAFLVIIHVECGLTHSAGSIKVSVILSFMDVVCGLTHGARSIANIDSLMT